MAKKINFTKDENNELNKFIKIIIILLLIFGVIAIFTIKLSNKNNKDDDKVVTINYDKTLIGNMFNHNEDDYYVIIYDFQDENATNIKEIVSNYKSSENYKKIYEADLSEGLNAKYKGTTNKEAKTLDEIKVSEIALIHLVNKQIVEYVDNLDEIKTILQ